MESKEDKMSLPKVTASQILASITGEASPIEPLPEVQPEPASIIETLVQPEVQPITNWPELSKAKATDAKYTERRIAEFTVLLAGNPSPSYRQLWQGQLEHWQAKSGLT